MIRGYSWILPKEVSDCLDVGMIETGTIRYDTIQYNTMR